MISSLNAFMEFQVPSSSSSFRPKKSWFKEVSQRAHGKKRATKKALVAFKADEKALDFPQVFMRENGGTKKGLVLVTSPNFCLPIQLTQNINLIKFNIFFKTILPLKITSWPCLQPGWGISTDWGPAFRAKAP